MKKSINLKKFFGNLIHKREYRTISSKAHHDWRVMVVTFFLVWIGIVLVSLYMFVQIDRGEIFSGTGKEEEKAGTVSKKLLEDTVDFFEGRKVKLEQIKTQNTSLPDPSI